MKAYTLFNLKPDISSEEYMKWSIEQVQPRMKKMESVLDFQDYEVKGQMGEGKPPYQFVEEITIMSSEAFEMDNSKGDGAVLAKEWADKVSDYTVIYCSDIK